MVGCSSNKSNPSSPTGSSAPVGLGNLTGVTLGYSAGAPNQGTVQATKSGKSYTIKGTATGVNMANPQQKLTKPFEMDVTCP